MMSKIIHIELYVYVLNVLIPGGFMSHISMSKTYESRFSLPELML